VVSRRSSRGSWNTYRDVLWFLKDVEKNIVIELKFSTGNKLRFILINAEAPSAQPVWPILLEVPRKVVHRYEEGAAYIGCDSSGRLVVWDPYRKVVEGYLDESLYEYIKTEYRYLRNVILLDTKLPVNIIESTVWCRVLDKEA